MRQPSTSPNFCMLPLVPFFVSSCPTNTSPLLFTVVLTALHFSFQQLFFAPGWVLYVLAPLRARRHTYSDSIEFA